MRYQICYEIAILLRYVVNVTGVPVDILHYFSIGDMHPALILY